MDRTMVEHSPYQLKVSTQVSTADNRREKMEKKSKGNKG